MAFFNTSRERLMFNLSRQGEFVNNKGENIIRWNVSRQGMIDSEFHGKWKHVWLNLTQSLYKLFVSVRMELEDDHWPWEAFSFLFF